MDLVVTDAPALVNYFDRQGGSALSSVYGAAYGSMISVSKVPAKDGYIFGVRYGVRYKEAACVIAWVFEADVVKGDATLLAKWIEKLPAKEPEDNNVEAPETEYSYYTSGSTAKKAGFPELAKEQSGSPES